MAEEDVSSLDSESSQSESVDDEMYMDEYGRIHYRQRDPEPPEGKTEVNDVVERAYYGKANAQPSFQHAADDYLGESDFDDFLGEFALDFSDFDDEFGDPRKPKRLMTYEPILQSDTWLGVVEKFKFGPLPDNEWPADALIMAMVVKLKNITHLNAWKACWELRVERDAIAIFRKEYARQHNLAKDTLS